MDAAVLHAAVRKLAATDLDLFLEQRALYRQLVSECAHRGVAVPKRPTRYADLLERMSAPTCEPVRSERVKGRKMPPTEPTEMRRIFRPYAGQILEVY